MVNRRAKVRQRFYIGFVVAFMLCAVVVDALLGKLYVRYMIVFSGAIFFWGMVVGQRSEQAWRRRLAVQWGRRPLPPQRNRMSEESGS